MDDDENKSVFCLPNDILNMILEFIPPEKLRPLARGCARLEQISENQRVREYRRRHRKVESDHLMDVFDRVTGSLKDPDMVIHKIRMRDGWMDTGLCQMLTLFPNIQLSSDAWAYETFADHLDSNPNNQQLICNRITNFRTNAGILDRMLNLKLKNLKRLRIWGTLTRDELQLVLQSHPLLTKLDIMAESADMDLLCNSSHKLSVFKLHDVTIGPDVNHLHLIRFLEAKGRHLTHLELTCRMDALHVNEQPVDLIAILRNNCPYLKRVMILKFLISFHMEYRGRHLRLLSFDEDSLLPLIQLFPKVRSFEIIHSKSRPDFNKVHLWINELEAFAETKKKRRIIFAEVSYRFAYPGTSMRGNLCLTVKQRDY